MKNADIEWLEAHVLQGNSGCSECQKIRTLVSHVRELQAFIVDLAKHHASPGPTPEKTAEHYQIVHRAKALRALI